MTWFNSCCGNFYTFFTLIIRSLLLFSYKNIILPKHFNKNFIYLDDLYNIFNFFFLEITITSHACQDEKRFYDLLKWKQMLIEKVVATSCYFFVGLDITISSKTCLCFLEHQLLYSIAIITSQECSCDSKEILLIIIVVQIGP